MHAAIHSGRMVPAKQHLGITLFIIRGGNQRRRGVGESPCVRKVVLERVHVHIDKSRTLTDVANGYYISRDRDYTDTTVKGGRGGGMEFNGQKETSS